MTLQEALRQYLDESGESMRALSLRAGLSPKAISDILTLPGLRPRHTTLVALSTATGKDLHACLQDQPLRYADLLRRLADDGNKSAASRIRWLLRQAGWVAEVEEHPSAPRGVEEVAPCRINRPNPSRARPSSSTTGTPATAGGR